MHAPIGSMLNSPAISPSIFTSGGRSLADLGRKLVRRLARTDSAFAGASGKPGAVQTEPERARPASEVPRANQTPVAPPLFRTGKFVAADVDGRSLPAVGGFDLDQPRPAVPLKAFDVIAVAIAIFF